LLVTINHLGDLCITWRNDPKAKPVRQLWVTWIVSNVRKTFSSRGLDLRGKLVAIGWLWKRCVARRSFPAAGARRNTMLGEVGAHAHAIGRTHMVGAGANTKTIIVIRYTNYRGETELRKIIPRMIHFVSTEWHPEEQWVLEAFDLERQADRSFALKDIVDWNPEGAEQSRINGTPHSSC
jgi:hypothetical protein